MTLNLIPVAVPNFAGTSTPLASYNDGTNNVVAHVLLDSTGTLMSPATSGNQTTANNSLATIATNLPAKGAAVSVSSLPVVIASDQAALPLPTGAATSAAQNTGNTSLAAIATSVAATATNTTSLATAAAQTTGNTSLAAIATATTAIASAAATEATSAKQDTGNTSLASIATNTTGAATAANQATEIAALGSILTACQAATPAGTNNIGSVSTTANTSGGTSTYSATGGTGNALLTGAAVAVKTSAGNLYGVNFVNTGGVAAYVQMFDAAQGSVTLGTTVPKLSFWVPAGGSWEEKFTGEAKISFATAITIAATTGATGSTAPAIGILANIVYK